MPEVKCLRRNMSQFFGPEERGDVGNNQQTVFVGRNKALVQIEQVPDQFKNRGDKEIQQPANH